MSEKRPVKSSKYHVVWTPKYRKGFLKGEIGKCVARTLQIEADRLKVEIVKIEMLPDHIHLFLDIPVSLSVQIYDLIKLRL